MAAEIRGGAHRAGTGETQQLADVAMTLVTLAQR
jgi:hypothetical protein